MWSSSSKSSSKAAPWGSGSRCAVSSPILDRHRGIDGPPLGKGLALDSQWAFLVFQQQLADANGACATPNLDSEEFVSVEDQRLGVDRPATGDFDGPLEPRDAAVITNLQAGSRIDQDATFSCATQVDFTQAGLGVALEPQCDA